MFIVLFLLQGELGTLKGQEVCITLDDVTHIFSRPYRLNDME
jgi:hypothetical protein